MYFLTVAEKAFLLFLTVAEKKTNPDLMCGFKVPQCVPLIANKWEMTPEML